MEKKYKLTDETKKTNGVVLHRIEAVRDFGNIKVGDKGGYVEVERNLSHDGNAWVSGDACVYGDAQVSGDACVYGNAQVYDNAKVCGNACVYGNAWVYGNAEVCGDAMVTSVSDYIVFKNWWSSGRYFTWTRSDDMWRVGCFYGTGSELVEKAYKDSEVSGREYEHIVNYVESVKAEINRLEASKRDEG